MFDIGWTELIVVAVVAILVVGPKDLPAMLRGFGKTMGNLRRMARDFQRQFDDALREAELDEVKKVANKPFQPLEDARKSMKEYKDEVTGSLKDSVHGEDPAEAGKAKSATADSGKETSAAKKETAGKAGSAKRAKSTPAAKSSTAKKSSAAKKATPAGKSSPSAAKSTGSKSGAAKPAAAKKTASKSNGAAKPAAKPAAAKSAKTSAAAKPKPAGAKKPAAKSTSRKPAERNASVAGSDK